MALNIGHVNAVSSKELHQPQHHQQRRTKPTSYSKKNTGTLTPFNKDQRPKVCRWHIFFGSAARKCNTWCQWPQKQICAISDTRPSSPYATTSESEEN